MSVNHNQIVADGDPVLPAGASRGMLWIQLFCVLVFSQRTVTAQETSAKTPQPPAVNDESAQIAPTPAVRQDDYIDLLVGSLAKGWLAFPEDSIAGETPVWSLKRAGADSEVQLTCTGKVKGFLFTQEQYEDFELMLEWQYPEDDDGNSGILVFTRNEPRIWPTSVQIQLHQPKVGSIFPSGDAKTDNTVDAPAELAKPIRQWNACRVICRGGRISVEVNGTRVGEVTGGRPAAGHIALQSEGSEVRFRRVRLRRLSKSEAAATETVEMPSASGSNDASPDET